MSRTTATVALSLLFLVAGALGQECQLPLSGGHPPLALSALPEPEAPPESTAMVIPSGLVEAVPCGICGQAAAQVLTIEPAPILGIAATHGTVGEGEIADIALHDGDPLAARVSPKYVFGRERRALLTSRHIYLAEPRNRR